MKDRWKCRNDGKRGRKRNTQAAHKHSGVAVSGTRVRVGRGFSSYLKTSSLGRKISPSPLFIDEESHTHTHRHTHTDTHTHTGQPPNTLQPHMMLLFFHRTNRQCINTQIQLKSQT